MTHTEFDSSGIKIFQASEEGFRSNVPNVEISFKNKLLFVYPPANFRGGRLGEKNANSSNKKTHKPPILSSPEI